jgi:polysaccharide export outer membrane protein
MNKIINLFFLFSLFIHPSPLMAENGHAFKLFPGDVLQITVWKEDGLDREILILPDGTFNFPLIGTVQTHDLSPQDLQALIKKRLEPFVPEAPVTVTVKAPLGHTVNVLGQVIKPGEIIMQGRLSVMQALSQSGGLTPYAQEEDIIVLRRTQTGKKSIPFPYEDIADGKNLDQDFDLEPGDVIVVPTAGLF